MLDSHIYHDMSDSHTYHDMSDNNISGQVELDRIAEREVISIFLLTPINILIVVECTNSRFAALSCLKT